MPEVFQVLALDYYVGNEKDDQQPISPLLVSLKIIVHNWKKNDIKRWYSEIY